MAVDTGTIKHYAGSSMGEALCGTDLPAIYIVAMKKDTTCPDCLAELDRIQQPEPVDVRAAAERASADMTAAVRRLAELSRTDSEMSSMVTVLEALTACGGPLAAIGDLCSEGAEWLQEFEHDDADTAADRMDDTAGGTESVSSGLDIVLRLIRPLAG
jgi:hypothetical protein